MNPSTSVSKPGLFNSEPVLCVVLFIVHICNMSSGKSERVKKLEKQVREMQESLAKKEAQIQQALDTKSEKELFLESQIKETRSMLEEMQSTIGEKNESIKMLQETLTEKEAKAMEEKHAGGKKKSVHHAEEKNALIDAVAAIAIGEREKNLQVLLEKARADREKALRVLVKIAGKDRIADFMTLHAGDPNLLDLLEEELLTK